jgi:hypothetical protein
LNVEDRPYNQLCWEVGRRKPDWRMRSPSVEGGDTITPSERGPLDPGGAVEAEVPHVEAGIPSGRGRAEGAIKLDREARDVGIGLNPPTKPGRVVAELAGARRLKPYWGKPTVRNFWEGGWKRDYGSRTEAQRESFGNATEPYRARASALPDGEQTPVRTPGREARHREHGLVVGTYDGYLEIRCTYYRNSNGYPSTSHSQS